MNSIIILTISAVIIWLSYKYIRPRYYQGYWALLYLLATIGLIGLIVSLSSCRTPQQLFEKAQKKGLKVDCKTDTLKVVDSVFIDGETKYFTKDSIVYQPFVNYVTKWETKYKYKTIHDSIQLVKYQTKWKVKEVKVQEKTKRKEARSNWFVWYLLGVGTVLIIYILWGVFKMYINPSQLFKDK